jgi:hypothetical protein
MAELRSQAYRREYYSRPEVQEREHMNSVLRARKNRIQATMRRLEAHSMPELIELLLEKCERKKIDITDKQDVFVELLTILHDSDPE